MKRAFFVAAVVVAFTLGFAKPASSGAVSGNEFVRIGLNDWFNTDENGQTVYWGYYYEFDEDGNELFVESTPDWFLIWEATEVTETVSGVATTKEGWELIDAGGELESLMFGSTIELWPGQTVPGTGILAP